MSEAVNLQPFSPADGLHSTITREEYDQIDRTSFSRLKLMGKSALQYRANARRDSPALVIGRAIHLATLEPERYASTVAVWTGKVRNGKAWDAFFQEHSDAGHEILTQNEDAHARAMAAAVHAKPAARKYLAHGTPETSVLWHANGLACKCRLDFDGDLALVELKSTVDAEPEAFGGQSYNLDYTGQYAWYSDGYYIATGIPKPTVVIAVEKQFPYEVVVYRVDHLIPRGRRQYLEWLDRLAYCTEHDIWPGYAEEEVDLPLPDRVPAEHFVTDSPAPVSSVVPPPLPRGQASEDVLGVAETTASSGTPNPVVAGSIPGRPANTDAGCMLFGCGAAALKDPESGGWFCGIHIGVPLSIRLEGKRAFRKEAAIGR